MPLPYGYTVAAAQYSAIRGDVRANLDTHMRMAEIAASAGVDFLVFPELSITGYELDLADGLQTTADDPLFMPLHTFASQHDMRVMVGVPLKAASGKPYLGSLILGGPTHIPYHKVHVHDSEAPYFQPDNKLGLIEHKGAKLELAICADLNHASHAARAAVHGADLYAASALISESGYAREAKVLEGYAREHQMAVLLANYATQSGSYIPPGGSAVWAPGGTQVALIDDTREAIVTATYTEAGWSSEIMGLDS